VPITAFAQDGRQIGWLQPRARRHAAVKDLVSGRKVSLPANRFASDLGPPDVLPSIAVGGNRVVYVLYEQQGNTEEHFFVVTTGIRDRTERLHASHVTNDCPCLGPPPSWRLAADGRTVVFAIGRTIYRLAGRRAVRIAGTAGEVAVSGKRYASAWLRSRGGCVCNLDPAWSRDGSLAYTAGQPLSSYAAGQPLSSYESAPAQMRIRVVGPSGREGRTIATGSEPDWSPDGSTIAYVRRTTDTAAIYIIRPDGSGGRRLVAGSQPVWHPGGRSLAFVRGNGIYVAALDGGNARRVVEGSSPDWSPDGRRLAFVRLSDIWVSNADGSEATRLTLHATDGERIAGDPAWSPDGRRLAYTLYYVPQATGQIVDTGVWVMNADGSERRQLGVGRSAFPAWSRDGSRIAYARWLATRHPARLTPPTEIFTAAPDGMQPIRVTTTSVAQPITSGFVRLFGRGKQSAQLKAEGFVLDLVLTPRFAALLVERTDGKRIVLLHPRTGRLLRRLEVPLETAPRISAAARNVVYSVGRRSGFSAWASPGRARSLWRPRCRAISRSRAGASHGSKTVAAGGSSEP
jgi:Dipeptidyl peptidase IV (DPP IV) N-terminal region/WD40-like Beta Propeller Repeat